MDFHLLGGKFYPKNRFYYALNEAELLEQISFDIAFIGAASVSDGLVSFEDEAKALLKKLKIDAHKVGITYTATPPEAVGLFLSKDYHAAILPEPMASVSILKGKTMD